MRLATRGTIAASVLLLIAAPAFAQVATSLLNEDDPLPGVPGQTVSSLSQPATNRVGGYACTVNGSDGGSTISHIWGNASGGPGAPLVSEGTYGVYEQTSFESFFGVADDGSPGYSAIATHTGTGTTGLDGAWVGTTPILVEEEPVAALPGQFSTFNSRVGITADGQPYWVGGVSTIQGGSTQTRVLFYGTTATPVLVAGDPIGGVAEPIDPSGSSIDFDVRFSALGTNYIVQVLLDASSTIDGTMVINGDAVMAGGSIVREGSPVPAAVGGLAGEDWDNFDSMGIAEDGTWFVTGDTTASTGVDEFVMLDGMIVLREGDVVETDAGDRMIVGSIESGYMNDAGTWAVVWDAEPLGGDDVEVLIVDGQIVLSEGDEVDMDGDGAVDPGATLANFTGIAALAVSEPNPDGSVDVYFTADVDTQGTSSSSDDVEGLYRINVEIVGPAIDVPLDIKPGSCPNTHNAVSQGSLPVAILGTEDLDVTQIDVSTIELRRADGTGGTVMPNEGPQGPHTLIGDVGTPVLDGEEECGCNASFSDGIADLRMFFRKGTLSDELELNDVASGESVALEIRGELLDGTRFEGVDCVLLVGNAVNTPAADAAGPKDDNAVFEFDSILDEGSNPRYDPFDRGEVDEVETPRTRGDRPGTGRLSPRR